MPPRHKVQMSVGGAVTGDKTAVGGHVETLDFRVLDRNLALEVADEVFGFATLVRGHAEEVGRVTVGHDDEMAGGEGLLLEDVAVGAVGVRAAQGQPGRLNGVR